MENHIGIYHGFLQAFRVAVIAFHRREFGEAQVGLGACFPHERESIHPSPGEFVAKSAAHKTTRTRD
jgi:hypothetical protein